MVPPSNEERETMIRTIPMIIIKSFIKKPIPLPAKSRKTKGASCTPINTKVRLSIPEIRRKNPIKVTMGLFIKSYIEIALCLISMKGLKLQTLWEGKGFLGKIFVKL